MIPQILNDSFENAFPDKEWYKPAVTMTQIISGSKMLTLNVLNGGGDRVGGRVGGE